MSFSKELVLWHAFDGYLKEVFEEIVEDFNHNSGAYKVVPIKKGNYKEVYEEGMKAQQEGKPPHILQVYEVATLSMMFSKKAFKPIGELMCKFHKKFDPDVYIDVIRKFYSDFEGRMLSLPWNASTGVLYYNKDLFKKSGLDEKKPPKTWDDMLKCCRALSKQNVKGFTTAWPSAYHLEHFSCWHNLPFSTMDNGFSGLGAQFNFNDAARISHMNMLQEWSKLGFFTYLGRYSEIPEDQFTKRTKPRKLQF